MMATSVPTAMITIDVRTAVDPSVMDLAYEVSPLLGYCVPQSDKIAKVN